MLESIIKLTLDTFRENRIQEPVVMQDDYGSRFIDVTFTTLGVLEPIPADAEVMINIKRADGESRSFSGEVNIDGTVRVPIKQWMCELDDRVTCTVSAVTDKKLSTMPFTVLVKPSPNTTDVPEAGTDDADILAEVLYNENARQAAEATRTANETARKTAENARQSAETQRLTDEANRVANEQQRVSAEASRDATFKSWATDISLLPDMSARISRNSKRLDGLEQRIKPSPFVFDDAVAYQKDVPSNAVVAAEIHKIGGMTYRDETTNTLRSAKVTVIKSVGVNLIPFPYTESTKTQNGVTFTVNDDGTINVNGTASASGSFSFYNSSELRVNGTYTLSGITGGDSTGSSLYYYQLYVDGTSKIFNPNGSRTEQLSGTVTKIVLFYKMGATFNNLTLKPMLNKGTTALPYTPYVEHSLAIPEAVQAIDGYGLGVSAEYHNYIDWLKKQFVQMVKKYIFTGNETVSIVRTRDDFCVFRVDCNITSMPLFAGGITIICDFADAIPNRLGVIDMVSAQIKYYGGKKPWFDISLPVFTEKEVLSLIAGQQMLYAIESPEITDISDLITADNLLPIEGGGTLTFENEYGYDVPSTVEYITAESDE